MAKFYQVGGSVRDKALGLDFKDIDYAVEADSFEDMHQSILDRGGEVFLSTPEYFTIRAKVPNLGACDFVLCRKEDSYSDGRHPDKVSVGTIQDDLARRDFTVNAIAIGEDDAIIDPFNGLKDLRKGLLRCVGKTKDRFTEDGLRMLRALRFSITKGFELDQEIEDCINDPDFFIPRLKGVSTERIREELDRCFRFNTNDTFTALVHCPDLRRWLLNSEALWLKPTVEKR